MFNPKAREAVEWYVKNRVLYQALAKKVESILREILELNKINYHSISSRAKTIASYKEKASKERYKEPRSDIKDMAGIRIITYTDSDAKRVSEIIKETFEIIPEYIVDKTEELGVDRVGYRSIHCIGTLEKERLKLPENKIFKDMCFEIQTRTMLQHAWAEFEHDRNYKFRGVLPKEIRRRLSILAGNLELIDREFDNISKDIDSYSKDVEKRTELGDISVPINSTSLRAYLNKKFETPVGEGVIYPVSIHDAVIEELLIMGIDTLEELDSKIPKDYMEKLRQTYPTTISEVTTFVGILRDVMLIHDADTYFKKAWRNGWHAIEKSGISLLESYGVDIRKHIKQYRLNIFP